MMAVADNVTHPLRAYLSQRKIKIAILLFTGRYFYKRREEIRDTWQNTAALRTIGRFAINQYFQSPSAADIIQRQQEKYDELYTKHYSRNATSIACKFSLQCTESVVSQRFNPKMKHLRTLIKECAKDRKYALFKELLCVGVCRSITLIFVNTLYHILLHIVFAMIARRNLYKKTEGTTTETATATATASTTEMEDQRKLFAMIHIFHKHVTESYAEMVTQKMSDTLIKHNDYSLNHCFESIEDLKLMLFEDIITASLQAFNSLILRNTMDVERVLLSSSSASSLQPQQHSNFVFCEMFYELDNVLKCADFNVLFSDCFREHIQSWLSDVLCVDFLQPAQIPPVVPPQPRKKLRYLNIMNAMIANYDALIQFKHDVESNAIEQRQSLMTSTRVTRPSVSEWTCAQLCEFVQAAHPMLANQFERLDLDGATLQTYDYLDVLHATQLHEFYLPLQMWQSIALQLQLPCAVDDTFMASKQKERTRLQRRQCGILRNIERLQNRLARVQRSLESCDHEALVVGDVVSMTEDSKLMDEDDEEEDGDGDGDGANVGDEDKQQQLRLMHNSEHEKFAMIFQEWAKYMLRLDEYHALKEFLNVVSGFDLVSSNSDYFNKNNGADGTSMFANVMDLMNGQTTADDCDDYKHDMQHMHMLDAADVDGMSMRTAAGGGQGGGGESVWNKTWQQLGNLHNMDWKKSAQQKWKTFSSYIASDNNGDDEEDVDVDVDVHCDEMRQRPTRGNSGVHRNGVTRSGNCSHVDERGESPLTSWRSS